MSAGRRAAPPLTAALLALAAVAAAGRPAPPAWVWWEGEAPVATNFPARSGFEAATFPAKHGVLSGGDWLTNGGPRTGAEAFARYAVAVPAAAAYHLWCRKFWKHGPFRWSFDGGPWTVCPKDVALADTTDIRQYLCANWVYLGDLTLAAGPHTFELRLLAGPGEELTAAFDCFLLTPDPFEPRGKLKPGEASGLADPGMFAWEPPPDSFKPDALLDLRDLNEKTAGEHGPVRREGDHFVLGDGSPVRFWAVGTSPEAGALAPDRVTYFARHLAKAGVNLVRIHGEFADDTPGYPVNPRKLDAIFALEAAFKAEGIYTYITTFWPPWYSAAPGTKDGTKTFGMIYFDPELQAAHRRWLKALLTTVNPRTGLTLAKDPALAVVELVNEDSLFFWTFTRKNLPPAAWAALERRFGEPLVEAWDMTREGRKAASPEQRARTARQIRFLMGIQRKFYEDGRKYIREELGATAMVNTSNWITADPAALDAVERYTYTAGDFMDRHGYFDRDHKGEGADYSVRVGHTFKDGSALKAPEDLPIQFLQTEGYPQTITEIGWTNPNRYRAEYPFLAAAYGSLQGVDGLFAFATGTPGWESSIEKFALSCPSILGNFPGYALLYRRGDVRTADPVYREVLDPEALADAVDGSAAPLALDALRARDVPAGAVPGTGSGPDPLAYYVGPVQRAFAHPAAGGFHRDLTGLVDRAHRRVTSATGELVWDYGRGVVTLLTDRAKGVAGFLKAAGPVALGNFTIDCRNEYATVLVIALDGLPLAGSRRILVQAMTVDRPYGFRTKGGTITDLGGAPLGVEKVDADLMLRLPGRWTGVALDPNGRPLPVHPESGAEACDEKHPVFRLPAEAAYTILSR